MDDELTEIIKKAASDADNEKILNTNNKEITRIKNEMLQELNLSNADFLSYSEKLKHFIYVDELPDLRYGCFIRWISLKNPDSLKLTNGSNICDIKINENGTLILCKGFSGSFFNLKMDECLIFRKLTNEERILLTAIDFIDT